MCSWSAGFLVAFSVRADEASSAARVAFDVAATPVDTAGRDRISSSSSLRGTSALRAAGVSLGIGCPACAGATLIEGLQGRSARESATAFGDCVFAQVVFAILTGEDCRVFSATSILSGSASAFRLPAGHQQPPGVPDKQGRLRERHREGKARLLDVHVGCAERRGACQ